MIDFYIKRGDTSPALRATLSDSSDENINLSGCSVYFNYKPRKSGDIVSRESNIYSSSSGIVEHFWISGDTDVAGVYNGEFVVTFLGGAQMTFPPNGPFVFEIVEDIS